MTTLSEFYTSIREALGRGNALDSTIVSKTRQAARWFERNGEPGYEYMKQFYEFTITSAGDRPHVLDAINSRVKCYLFFRIVLSDGSYKYLKKINPKDVAVLDTGTPQGYWIDGTGRIFLDCKPDENYSAELMVVEYSAWGTDGTFTHWLLDNAEDFMFNQVMLMMAPWIRDARMRETFKQGRDEALTTLEFAKIDMENSDFDVAMIYTGETDET